MTNDGDLFYTMAVISILEIHQLITNASPSIGKHVIRNSSFVIV